MAKSRVWKRLKIPPNESTAVDFDTISLDGKLVEIVKPLPQTTDWFKVRSLDGETVAQAHRSWLHDVPPEEAPIPPCICPRPHDCTCGAFYAEQIRKGLLWNKWTKTWYDPNKPPRGLH